MNERNSKNAWVLREAAAYVYETFVVEEQEAAAHAAGMLDVVESHGGDSSNISFDRLCVLLNKSLGERYEWRSEAKKQQWLARKEEGVKGYNAYIDRGLSSPFKRW